MPKDFERRAGLFFMALTLLTGLWAPLYGEPVYLLLCLVPYVCCLFWHEARKARDEIRGRAAHWDRKPAERLASR